MAVVVTGFGPFRNHKVNISSEAVKELDKLWQNDDLCKKEGIELITDELEVSFECVRKNVDFIWNNHKPRLVIHVGVHADTKSILLEDSAFNSNYEMPDVCGNTCDQNGCCHANGVNCLQTTLDVKSACLQAKEAGFQVDISHDPGRYLCGFIYYNSLMIDPGRVVFVHVPPREKGGCPKRLAECLLVFIKNLLDQIPQ